MNEHVVSINSVLHEISMLDDKGIHEPTDQDIG